MGSFIIMGHEPNSSFKVFTRDLYGKRKEFSIEGHTYYREYYTCLFPLAREVSKPKEIWSAKEVSEFLGGKYNANFGFIFVRLDEEGIPYSLKWQDDNPYNMEVDFVRIDIIKEFLKDLSAKELISLAELFLIFLQNKKLIKQYRTLKGQGWDVKRQWEELEILLEKIPHLAHDGVVESRDEILDTFPDVYVLYPTRIALLTTVDGLIGSKRLMKEKGRDRFLSDPIEKGTEFEFRLGEEFYIGIMKDYKSKTPREAIHRYIKVGGFFYSFDRLEEVIKQFGDCKFYYDEDALIVTDGKFVYLHMGFSRKVPPPLTTEEELKEIEKLKVSLLKSILKEKEIKIPHDAKKPDLIELYIRTLREAENPLLRKKREEAEYDLEDDDF